MAHSHSVREYPGQIAGIAALSVMVGAASAILFTPKRGTEVRRDLKRRTMIMKKRLQKSQSSMRKAKRPTRSAASATRRSASSTRAKTSTARRRTTKQDEVADRIRRHGEP